MQYREFGNTGLKVSEIGFGSWAIGGTQVGGGQQWGWGEVPEADALAALTRARELGVNFFDTANTYGNGRSEENLGRAFCGRWGDTLVATKLGYTERNGVSVQDFSRHHILEQCEGSLRRLKKDVIDVYQLHNPSADVIRNGDWPETMERLREQGKIRFYGVSIFLPEDALAFLERGSGYSIQLAFNALRMEMVEKVFPAAMEKKVAIIARVAMYYGLLSGKFKADHRFAENDHRSHSLDPETMRQLVPRAERIRQQFNLSTENGEFARWSLRFAISHPAVSVVIPGARNAQQAEQNSAVSDGTLVPKGQFDAVYKMWREDEYLRNLRVGL